MTSTLTKLPLTMLSNHHKRYKCNLFIITKLTQSYILTDLLLINISPFYTPATLYCGVAVGLAASCSHCKPSFSQYACHLYLCSIRSVYSLYPVPKPFHLKDRLSSTLKNLKGAMNFADECKSWNQTQDTHLSLTPYSLHEVLSLFEGGRGGRRGKSRDGGGGRGGRIGESRDWLRLAIVRHQTLN